MRVNNTGITGHRTAPSLSLLPSLENESQLTISDLISPSDPPVDFKTARACACVSAQVTITVVIEIIKNSSDRSETSTPTSGLNSLGLTLVLQQCVFQVESYDPTHVCSKCASMTIVLFMWQLAEVSKYKYSNNTRLAGAKSQSKY